MKRTEIRDNAFKILYQKAVRGEEIDALYEACAEAGEIAVNEKVREMVDGTLAHWDEFDGILAKHSPSRDVSRIAKINLAILKLALYEIKYDEGTPVNAAISEAMSLADEYTYAEDISFINGVLGAVADELPQSK